MLDELTFQIIGPATYQPTEEFQRLVQALLAGSGLALLEHDNGLCQILARDRLVGSLQLAQYADFAAGSENDANQEKRPITITFKVPRTDRNIIQYIRVVLAKSFRNYSLFSEGWQARLPVDPNLLSFEVNPLDNDVDIVMRDRGLIPRYLFLPAQVTYAQAHDGSVHIVNSSLVSYFVKNRTQVPETAKSEFNYPVAADLDYFSSMFEQGLIPFSFYEYWQKSLKIINHSFFPLAPANRDILFRTRFCDFKPRPSGVQGQNLDGVVAGVSRELKEGQDLNEVLLHLVSDELKIAEDYVRAVILRDVEFEQSESGQLLPRLSINLFLEHLH